MCVAQLDSMCPAASKNRRSNMSFRTIIASALIALSLMAGGASAYAASNTGEYDGYPTWAQGAFEAHGEGG